MINRNLIIQEASLKAQQIINNNSFSGSDLAGGAAGNLLNGHSAGKAAGHEVVGSLLGKEAHL